MSQVYQLQIKDQMSHSITIHSEIYPDLMSAVYAATRHFRDNWSSTKSSTPYNRQIDNFQRKLLNNRQVATDSYVYSISEMEIQPQIHPEPPEETETYPSHLTDLFHGEIWKYVTHRGLCDCL